MLNFTGNEKTFQLKGDLLEMITEYKFSIDHSKSMVKKLYDCGKEKHCVTIHIGDKITGDKSLARLLKSPAIMARGLPKDRPTLRNPNQSQPK